MVVPVHCFVHMLRDSCCLLHFLASVMCVCIVYNIYIQYIDEDLDVRTVYIQLYMSIIGKV